MKRSALTAAAARAAHLIVDAEPFIFADTLAYQVLGEQAEELVQYHRLHGTHPILAGARATVTTRSHYTETRLAASGLDQYVVLGAGLDTFAYRATGIRIFEVDHPATQARKLELLAAAGIPASATYVPVDFEQDSLTKQLVHGGLDPARPAFVSWLGVTMYLTPQAIAQTLADLSTLAPGTEIVFDYLLPEDLRDPAGQAYAAAISAHSAENGEPWLSFFRPDQLALQGFSLIETVGQHDLPCLKNRADALTASALSMIAHARLR
ncbi:class I SAM-dependent methyltransferase [Actinocrispum sp. NPDC049592]|uniref:class I SAM-dependent methyltransferase n=1 Tax=Actinocrispum sp. NPDC049592 TaxID=3154835 RepID=UPI003416BD35